MTTDRTDYTTSLTAALERAASAVRDEIAKEGLSALKHVLDRAGFGESEHLKDFKVYAHVTSDDEIEFEILLDVESVSAEDMPNPPSMDETIQKRIRTFAMYGFGGVDRIEGLKDQRRDARKPARDARHSASEARKKYHDHRRDGIDRTIEHQFSLYAPRDMKIDREGKLALLFKKSMKQTSGGVQYPKGNFGGIVDSFMKELSKVVAEKFGPELEQILARWSGD